MKRLFPLLFTLLCATSLAAQTDLWVEGRLLARDVQRTGSMPEALQQLLRGRSVQQKTSPRRVRGTRSSSIGPLLASVRGQKAPYNLLCPYWQKEDGTLSDERCLSGCVATAIEQVMAYYRYPEALKDTLHGWQTDHYTIADLLPGTRFDWEHYLLDYRSGWTTEQGMAIALPTLAAGMAVHMSYGPSSSGASVYRAVEPLQRALDYGMVRYYDRVCYTPERWYAMLKHELQQGRPIVYAGHTMTMDGHCFNVDGIDDQGLFHINWGYSGDYDGWYDLDRLSPWEPVYSDDGGLLMGFFSNQSALFMHPSAEAEPLDPDSMQLDRLGVVLEKIDLQRTPDTRGYIGADFHFRHDGTDAVTYTYEIMTWLPTDTAIFRQADYVGLSAITLSPGERRSQRVYLRFTEPGDRLLGISHDDITIPYSQAVRIETGVTPKLEWGSTAMESVWNESTGGYDCTFSVPVRNSAVAGYAGNSVTLCLSVAGHESEELRHYRVLSLAGGSETTVSVTFTALAPATSYTFLVRCPWAVQSQLSFTTPIPSHIEALSRDSRDTSKPLWYNLSGQKASTNSRGILISSDRQKWFLR